MQLDWDGILNLEDNNSILLEDGFYLITEQATFREVGGIGTGAIATRYPVTSGITSQTTTQVGRAKNLTPLQGSLVSRREKVGL